MLEKELLRIIRNDEYQIIPNVRKNEILSWLGDDVDLDRLEYEFSTMPSRAPIGVVQLLEPPAVQPKQ